MVQVFVHQIQQHIFTVYALPLYPLYFTCEFKLTALLSAFKLWCNFAFLHSSCSDYSQLANAAAAAQQFAGVGAAAGAAAGLAGQPGGLAGQAQAAALAAQAAAYSAQSAAAAQSQGSAAAAQAAAAAAAAPSAPGKARSSMSLQLLSGR